MSGSAEFNRPLRSFAQPIESAYVLRAGMTALYALAITFAFAAFSALSAAAQSPIRVKIVKDGVVPGDLVYWLAAPSLSPSGQRPLPAPDATGAIVIEVPPSYDLPGAQIKILDERKGLLAHVPIRDSSGRAAVNLLGPNLLQNGDFQHESDRWTTELGGGAAKGQLEWIGGAEMPEGATGRILRVRVTAIDSTNWHVQVHQTGLDLKESEPYTLTFWARADRARPLSINATVDKDDFHWIGLSNQIGLTTEWRKFNLVFTATRTLRSHNRLGFVLGDAVGAIDLAGVMLQHGAAAGPLGGNVLRNSNFNRGAESWSMSAVAPARAKSKTPADIAPPREVQGKVAEVEVTDPGTQAWHVQLFQTGIDLAEHQPYTLSFWARSNRSRPLSIIAGEDKDDYHTAGLDNYALLEPSWHRYVYVFTATRTVRNSQRLTFLMGDSVGGVDLANIELKPGAEAMIEPGGSIEARLSGSDFKYAQAVSVPVRYKGKPVQDLTVALQFRDETIATVRMQPADAGSARFTDVPIDEKLAVVVSDGTQTASFPRIVPSDSPDSVSDIEVPSNWPPVKTGPDVIASHPLVGAWQSQAGAALPRFVTTFNADGTGTIRRMTEDTGPAAPITAPPSGAFLWHAKTGTRSNVIVMGNQEITWSISGSGKNQKLTLKDAKGAIHTLFRR